MILRHIPVRRRGFTLIELMVVIGVILLLMTLTIGVMRGALTAARQRQTEATVQKIHGLVQQRIDAFNRAMDRLNLNLPMQKVRLNFNQNYASNQLFLNQNSPALTPLTRKQLFQSRFPQNFAERNLLASSGNQTLPPPAPHKPVTQSSALLYWLLTNSEVFGIPPVDPSEFTAAEVRDTDGDGLNEFIDGWGNPLRFYRWPTQLFRPNGSTNPINRLLPAAIWSALPPPPAVDASGNTTDIDPLMRDPDDPTAQLAIVANAGGATVQMAIEDLYHTPATFNAFLIVSAGADNLLGMHEPFDFFGTSDPTQVPPNTMTWQWQNMTSQQGGTTQPTLQIPLVSTPAYPSLGTPQGRLAAVNPVSATLDNHPINDNISNRKRH